MLSVQITLALYRKVGSMGKITGFLEEVWREVHPTHGRVVWPSWDKVVKSTYVVVIMSSIISIFLWGTDAGFGKIITDILFS